MQIVKPMKAADLTREVDLSAPDLGLNRFFTDPHRYAMEPKVDGCRINLVLNSVGNRILSRGRDVTDHFPHLASATIEGADGIVLDGELLANGPDGIKLSAATSLLVAGTQTALDKQRTYGPAWMIVFDIIGAAPEQQNPMQLTYDERREILQVLIPGMGVPGLTEAAMMATQFEFDDDPRGGTLETIQLIPSYPASAHLIDAFRSGEGFMIKDRSGKYIPDGWEGAGWWKFKWLSTCDAFITGWKPGKGSNAGKVGSVTVALANSNARGSDGSQLYHLIRGDIATGVSVPVHIDVATVGVFTEDERRKMTDVRGRLHDDYYGRVMEFACQGIGTQGMARHPRFIRWRDDKSPEDCDLAQLAAIPVV